jgi:hypothetical protein
MFASMAHQAVAETVGKKVKLQKIEEVLELESLKLAIDDSSQGFVYEGQVRYPITSNTVAKQDGKVVPLVSAKSRLGKSAVVKYDIKTQKVTQISWTTK